MVLTDNIIRHVKVGQIIAVTECNEYSGKGNVLKKYKVIAVYPYHVLCERKNGIRRSICYGELIQTGYEKQLTKYELLKRDSVHLRRWL